MSQAYLRFAKGDDNHVKEAVMLKAVRRDEAKVYHLLGRDWFYCIGPENTDARNVALGVAVFPAGSTPPGHVHDAEEELIYIVSGEGKLVTPQETVALSPGIAVYIPVGLHHATVCEGPEPLELISVFSPPVIPGAYEATPGKGAGAAS
jgi:mannose-6-phosphate isomerase-like protein (cupin superfamily)